MRPRVWLTTSSTAACTDGTSSTCTVFRAWPHADVQHSKPAIVTYAISPSIEQYMFYIQSNGLLTAVDTATGVEKWNFMVEEALPQIQNQISQQENGLSVLLGRNPGPVKRGADIAQLNAPQVPAGLPFIDFDATGPDGFEVLLDHGPFAAVSPGPRETAMVLYTSGSTGRPGQRTAPDNIHLSCGAGFKRSRLAGRRSSDACGART